MIFDSLCHPTINGQFFNPGDMVSFEKIAREVKEEGFKRACAVGLPNIGGYSHDEFFKYCEKYTDVFYPVAGIDFSKSIESELEEIVNVGYKALKVHPRVLGASFSLDKLSECLNLAYEKNIVVFFCTYNYSNLMSDSMCLNYEQIVSILKKSSPAKIILLHGGVMDLLKYAELVRNNSNLLLDLSFTFMKYAGSSLDMDIKYLFEKFDRRICVGSDNPDFSFRDFKRRFKEFSKGISSEKTKNIAYKNLESFLGID